MLFIKIIANGKAVIVIIVITKLKILTRADIVRDLGVLIDFSLHFDKHIDNIIKKASNVSKLILWSFSTRDQNILIKAFCTYVRPILEYSFPVWSPIGSHL